ncbi:hypothetical protein PXNS11_310300 [Stutzerimonas xanthomarina]|nr:hypothetical protein PXNS11_310300 [Stutzerimonas xanthomarina]
MAGAPEGHPPARSHKWRGLPTVLAIWLPLR